jgi:hypothetical protein
MNLKDRGNKKWPAMMLTEHRLRLNIILIKKLLFCLSKMYTNISS